MHSGIVSFSPLRACVCAALLGLLGSPVFGQRVDAAAKVVQHQAALETALTLFLAKDYDRGEQALFRINKHTLNTFEGDIESASALIHLASMLRQRYDVRASLEATYRALGFLQDADEKRAVGIEPRRRAHLEELKGFAAERLLRDETLAKRAYEKAIQFDPRSIAGKAGLDRLTAAKDETNRGATRPGKN